VSWIEPALWLLLGACSLYYLAALIAGLSFRTHSFPCSRSPGTSLQAPAGNVFTAPVSMLKPVRGLDPDFYGAIHSHAAQDYPEFEILFAVSDAADPAVPEIRRLAAAFPARRIELFVTDRYYGPNAKVNSLERLLREARHEILVISDSDIHVAPDYLRRIVAPLAQPSVGLVTCPYRGVPQICGHPKLGAYLAAVLESLWISTDFHAGVLVARVLGLSFALGATMVVRRSAIEKAGGFGPLAAYLADDYQLSQAIALPGSKIVLSDCVVETTLPVESWSRSWEHRVRWARTLHVCRPGGYAGLIVTFAVPLSLAALTIRFSLWPLAAACVLLRLLAAYVVAVRRLRDRLASSVYFLLIPLADLVSLAVWVASFFGRTVVWRGEKFRLNRSGELTPI